MWMAIIDFLKLDDKFSAVVKVDQTSSKTDWHEIRQKFRFLGHPIWDTLKLTIILNLSSSFKKFIIAGMYYKSTTEGQWLHGQHNATWSSGWKTYQVQYWLKRCLALKQSSWGQCLAFSSSIYVIDFPALNEERIDNSITKHIRALKWCDVWQIVLPYTLL